MKFGMIKSIVSQTLDYGDFTDGGGAAGSIEFDTDLPAGAIPLAWRAKATDGFTGDTSAVISVGIDGDADKYSADTAQSVFAAGTVGSLVLAAAAMQDDFATAQTPVVTVTAGTDWGAVDGGSMVVEIFYIEPEPFA
jgi:hypothetical protein